MVSWPSAEPAIDIDNRPAYVSSAFRNQKRYHIGNFFRFAQPAARQGRDELLPALAITQLVAGGTSSTLPGTAR